MTTAPILPFRLRSKSWQHAWTGAHTSTIDTDFGLIRLEEGRIVIEINRSRKVTHMSAMGSVDTKYENFPVEERSIDFSDIDGVSFRVPTWDFWTAPRVVFHVREMRVLEGLPSPGPAEFSVPVSNRDRALANAFVVQCHLAISSERLPLEAPGHLGAEALGP
jgi:hypothetical protein